MAAYGNTVLGLPGLRAFWRLAEPTGTNADELVNNLDGTYTNTPTQGVTSLININEPSDKAATFVKASQESVLIPDNVALDGYTQLTLAAWVKVASQPVNSAGQQ